MVGGVAADCKEKEVEHQVGGGGEKKRGFGWWVVVVVVLVVQKTGGRENEEVGSSGLLVEEVRRVLFLGGGAQGRAGTNPRNGGSQDVRECVHRRVDRGMVLLQHRSAAVEQVSTEQLRLQIPHLLDHVSHDGMCIVQLHSNRMDEDSAHASNQIQDPVCEDHSSECHLLYLGGEWQHLVALLTSLFQSSHWSHHSLLHCCVCLLLDIQKRSMVGVWDPHPCGHRCGDC